MRESRYITLMPEGEDLGGQEEEMNSPPLTPGHDSNSDDPDLVSLDRIVASLRTKLTTQRMEARAAAPSPYQRATKEAAR